MCPEGSTPQISKQAALHSWGGHAASSTSPHTTLSSGGQGLGGRRGAHCTRAAMRFPRREGRFSAGLSTSPAGCESGPRAAVFHPHTSTTRGCA